MSQKNGCVRDNVSVSVTDKSSLSRTSTDHPRQPFSEISLSVFSLSISQACQTPGQDFAPKLASCHYVLPVEQKSTHAHLRKGGARVTKLKPQRYWLFPHSVAWKTQGIINSCWGFCFRMMVLFLRTFSKFWPSDCDFVSLEKNVRDISVSLWYFIKQVPRTNETMLLNNVQVSDTTNLVKTDKKESQTEENGEKNPRELERERRLLIYP